MKTDNLPPKIKISTKDEPFVRLSDYYQEFVLTTIYLIPGIFTILGLGDYLFDGLFSTNSSIILIYVTFGWVFIVLIYAFNYRPSFWYWQLQVDKYGVSRFFKKKRGVFIEWKNITGIKLIKTEDITHKKKLYTNNVVLLISDPDDTYEIDNTFYVRKEFNDLLKLVICYSKKHDIDFVDDRKQVKTERVVLKQKKMQRIINPMWKSQLIIVLIIMFGIPFICVTIMVYKFGYDKLMLALMVYLPIVISFFMLIIFHINKSTPRYVYFSKDGFLFKEYGAHKSIAWKDIEVIHSEHSSWFPSYITTSSGKTIYISYLDKAIIQKIKQYHKRYGREE